MDPKHVSLIKKAIRMIDYMRADLVGILEANVVQTAEKLINPPSLYADFDTANAVQPDRMAQVPFRDKALPDPVVNDDGAHFADCPCAGCEFRRNTTVQEAVAQDRDALSVEDAITVDRLDTSVNPGDVPEPDDTHSLFTEAVPAPVAPVITEYERRKRELHALHGTAGAPGEVCGAKYAPPGVACLCAKCRA